MSDLAGLDPRTPVLVGVGQSSDPVDSPDYHRWSAVDLAAEAARRALDDAGIDPTTIDTVAGVRQFETSTPFADAPLGRSDNFPRSVAARVGADPERAILEVSGGQSPQHLVNELAKGIAEGRAGTVLLFGSEAISTTRRWAGQDDAPDFTETVGGQLDDRGYGLEGLINEYEIHHGLTTAPAQYAMFEQARRRRLGLDRDEYAAEIGRLFAPFTAVAARNPFAAAPTERSADELMTVTERNRLIADPYPRFVVARDQVNQGAALVLTSVGAAREAGIPQDRWVFMHGYADLRELNVMERPDLSSSPAAVRASLSALDRAGASVEDMGTFDLYSCFAIAVLNVADGLGLAADDPRGLTLTGGLPFFGGAGNNYSMHAIAETAVAVRAHPGDRGFVGANGGMLSKYSVGIYSTEPRPFEVHSDVEQQDALNDGPKVTTTERPDGATAFVETYTVTAARDGSHEGIVVGRLADGTRTLATTRPGDEDAVRTLLSGDAFDATFTVRAGDRRNFVADLTT